ncbi:response regulator [Limnospira fusiformis KN01]|uniref:hybrid sensor histidine kinase/response regulator n=1 Tax=Limnospira TaxID=2596745 RepID=UPI0016587625|nr:MULTISPECIES: ATP-binding protein [Limnospira]MDT9186904.1 response regulator [Limnospira sp. PMC 894.15]MDT9198305.1 response regulator [Limnospira sp. PMC 1042.18]MDT9232981.1 response regulator [Limnospira sp. PMC 917.15]MDT9273332.1 response regulator [Limnospira sp. PMC 737.11]ULB47954.1 response regulator [Limnospira fusiformis KN01]
MATILIVDDDIATQMILQNTLEEQGYKVAIAEDGKTALELAESLSPELIICDWMLPELNGLEVCQKLRSHPTLAPTFFIILTAQEQLEDSSSMADLTAQYRVDEWMSKPIEIDGLLARVRCGLKISAQNKHLKQAYQQLLYSEKMLNLGQMVSGIAHEINNPVSFVTGNINHATGYAQDLMELVELYGETYPEPAADIEERIEDIDLEFLLEDFPKLLESIKLGTDRIRHLVESLRNFYKQDDGELKTVDIHQGLADILLILQGRIKGKKGRGIQMVENYGKLPQVQCYPGQLNQVFMNLLNNAIDSLDTNREEDNEFQPQIQITTEAETSDKSGEGWVTIRIYDNGDGIPESVCDRIFEPLFTTKPPQIGTGMGLSLSHKIITESHRGTIEVKSDPETGTEFIIKIPQQQTPTSD